MKEEIHPMSLRIPAWLHQSLKDEAKRQDRSVNWLIDKLLKAAMATNSKQGAQQ